MTERTDRVRIKLKRAFLLENVIAHHLGLQGKDGKRLLEDIKDALRRYIAKHPKKPILITAEYVRPP
jgi:hypothetical protein